jgi:hypothetical protein
VSAILFASIFGLICFFIAKYVLSPVMGPIFNFFEFIYDNVLEPIINIFTNKNKQTSHKNTTKNSPEKDLLVGMSSQVRTWLSSDSEIPFLDQKMILIDFNLMLAGKKKFSYQFWRWINFIRWHQLTFEI